MLEVFRCGKFLTLKKCTACGMIFWCSSRHSYRRWKTCYQWSEPRTESLAAHKWFNMHWNFQECNCFRNKEKIVLYVFRILPRTLPQFWEITWLMITVLGFLLNCQCYRPVSVFTGSCHIHVDSKYGFMHLTTSWCHLEQCYLKWQCATR